jgi:hypothetical protein
MSYPVKYLSCTYVGMLKLPVPVLLKLVSFLVVKTKIGAYTITVEFSIVRSCGLFVIGNASSTGTKY